MSLQVLEIDIVPGDEVRITDVIIGVVEEVIFSRNVCMPYLLVEYWHQGELVSKRLHAEDCQKVGVNA